MKDTEIKLYIPFYDVELSTIDFSYKDNIPSMRWIDIYKNNIIIGYFGIDERCNKITKDIVDNFPESNLDLTKLFVHFIKSYHSLKSTDISYGSIGSGDEYEYEGTKTLYVRDYFEFLKQENREETINKLVNQ